MSCQVFIVEDHPLMRAIMQEFLCDLPGVEVNAAAASAEQAIEALEATPGRHPHVLLVDVALPGMSGIELVHQVSSRWPDIRCIMLSGHLRPSYVERALAAGAIDYLPKGEPEKVAAAIRGVIEGRA